jgi:hypothetical protein
MVNVSRWAQVRAVDIQGWIKSELQPPKSP